MSLLKRVAATAAALALPATTWVALAGPAAYAVTASDTQPLPEPVVTTPAGDPAEDVRFPARTRLTLRLTSEADDLAGFCWAVHRTMLSVTGVGETPCSGGGEQWTPVPAGTTTATVMLDHPTIWPGTTLAVQARGTSGHVSPTTQVRLSAHLPEFVYGPGRTPATGRAFGDLHGDLNGDGYADLVATDSKGGLRLYPGKGTGSFGSGSTIGSSGWNGALIAHGGDFRGVLGATDAPDGYEDYLVRFAGSSKLWLYPNSGLGTPYRWTRSELLRPAVNGVRQDWSRVRQLLLPGDLDGNTAEGRKGGKDLLVRDCVDAACTDAGLVLYPGQTIIDGYANHMAPFALGSPLRLGATGWRNTTVLSVGDQNGDGVKDLVTRDASTGRLGLRPGKITNGVYSLGSRVTYAASGFSAAERPRLTSAGNVQGSVVSRTHTDPETGAETAYRQFRPVTGQGYGDVWATTAADPAKTVTYLDANGAKASRTCPTGCLLFHPGGSTAPDTPRLAGTAGWDTTITGIF